MPLPFHAIVSCGVNVLFLQPGVSHTALCEAVEAHKLLAAQEGRLELLLQQLADKEALLEQARQLVGAHTTCRVHILYAANVELCVC